MMRTLEHPNIPNVECLTSLQPLDLVRNDWNQSVFFYRQGNRKS